jgi:hypothetical protein
LGHVGLDKLIALQMSLSLVKESGAIVEPTGKIGRAFYLE